MVLLVPCLWPRETDLRLLSPRAGRGPFVLGRDALSQRGRGLPGEHRAYGLHHPEPSSQRWERLPRPGPCPPQPLWGSWSPPLPPCLLVPVPTPTPHLPGAQAIPWVSAAGRRHSACTPLFQGEIFLFWVTEPFVDREEADGPSPRGAPGCEMQLLLVVSGASRSLPGTAGARLQASRCGRPVRGHFLRPELPRGSSASVLSLSAPVGRAAMFSCRGAAAAPCPLRSTTGQSSAGDLGVFACVPSRWCSPLRAAVGHAGQQRQGALRPVVWAGLWGWGRGWGRRHGEGG